MTRLEDLKPEDLVNALLKGLVGKHAVRLISAIKVVAPEAGAMRPCLKRTH